MKKAIMLMLALILLVACSKPLERWEEGLVTVEGHGRGKFEGVVKQDQVGDLNAASGAYEDFVIDENLALIIGDAVLFNVYGKELVDTTIFSVSEVKKKDVFVVCRMPIPLRPGYDYNVMISKSDGQILKIWMGE